jgi:hypothetical protein
MTNKYRVKATCHNLQGRLYGLCIGMQDTSLWLLLTRYFVDFSRKGV